jgi:predicted nucleic acid-binding protein
VILADTSVWIDHFRRRNQRLMDALENGDVVTHPFVIGELACGNLRNRREILDLLHLLPTAIVATDREALAFIEKRKLMGRDLGYVDVHLLASAALSPDVTLWSLDERLRRLSVSS